MSRLLSRVRAALHDPAELAKLDAELKANWMRVGDYHWNGAECFQCIAIDELGSHRELVVATAVVVATGMRWICPGCFRPVYSSAPTLRQDPRCHRCQVLDAPFSPEAREALEKPPVDLGSFAEYADDDCEPTLRDPSLPPVVPGIRDAAAGAPDSRG